MSGDKFANPAPLGLGGFALTTFVLSCHNAGYIAIGAALPLALVYGGLAQMIAGYLEFRTGNTFGVTAFTSYGAFWIAFGGMVYAQMHNWLAPEAVQGWLPVTLVAWTIFTAILWVGTFRATKALNVLFSALLLTFALLDVSTISGNAAVAKIAGFVGIFTAFAAWYVMAGNVLNPMFGREVLPMGALQQAAIPAAKAEEKPRAMAAHA